MRSALAVWRLLRTVLHLLHGLVLVWLSFGRLDADGRQRRIRWWAGKLLQVLGVELELRGTFTEGATLLVANHVSWLDIVAIHAVHPRTRFVSKADVKHWPLVGALVHAAGTLFIERERKRDALRVVHQMAEALNDGDTVGVFPEGTTGEGERLLPFHANLLQAAVVTDTRVQPVALRYADDEHRFSTAVAYVGQTTIAQSLWRVACGRGLRVHVAALPPVRVGHTERRALTQKLQQLIAAELE
jgi:1-acyl-sn-glycerol-3-phosphate acyltransferase